MLSTFLPQGLCTSHSFVSNVALLSPLTHWISAQKCLILSNASVHVPRCTPGVGPSHCESQTITMSVCSPAHCLAPWPEYEVHQCRNPVSLSLQGLAWYLTVRLAVVFSFFFFFKIKDSELVPWNSFIFHYSQPSESVSSVIQLCPTFCNPMDCSMPGFPVHHQLPEFTQIHVHQLGDAIQPSQPLLSPFSSCRQSFPASGSFPMSHFFTSGGQSTGVSASASVLPVNTQDWFILGWTGWISLQSKGLSRVFSDTTVQKHQFFSTSALYSPTLTSTHDYWKNHSFD